MIGEKSWEVTFSDVLMLLLTFLVFIISVSVFKNDDYKKFWKNYSGITNNKNINDDGKKSSSDSNEINPIPELNIPFLSKQAVNILRQAGEVIDATNELNLLDSGDKIFYDENRISLMISEKISFDSGNSKLKKSIKNLLLKFIPILNNNDFPINITGHTDSTVSPMVDNLSLSLDRAVSIADFLIKNGVNKDRVSVSGYGPYRPLYTNLTKEGRQKNRRVEINILINKPNKM